MTSFQPATESQTGHIGARQARVEDAALLCGLGCYADDAAVPVGTLHAAIIRSPHAHARITSVDFSGALLMKGVRGVLVGEDVKRWALPFPVGVRQPMEHWCVAVDKVRYVGEPVAVVIAENRYLAEDAIEVINQHHLLDRVSDLIDQGVLRTTVGEHFGAINAANMRRAHALIESGKARGKIVLEGF